MKNFILALVTLSLFTSCREEIIDYNSALANCVPDTIKGFIENDTLISISPGIKCIIDAELPTFRGVTMEGDSITDEYFKDKVTVINFWFIGCKPCEAEIPGLNKLVEKYSSQPVNFLAIGRNSPKDIDEFISTNPFEFDHIAYGEPIIRGNFQSRWGYPVTIIADENRKIIFADTGGASDSSAIDKIQSKLIPVIDRAL